MLDGDTLLTCEKRLKNYSNGSEERSVTTHGAGTRIHCACFCPTVLKRKATVKADVAEFSV